MDEVGGGMHVSLAVTAAVIGTNVTTAAATAAATWEKSRPKPPQSATIILPWSGSLILADGSLSGDPESDAEIFHPKFTQALKKGIELLQLVYCDEQGRGVRLGYVEIKATPNGHRILIRDELQNPMKGMGEIQTKLNAGPPLRSGAGRQPQSVSELRLPIWVEDETGAMEVFGLHAGSSLPDHEAFLFCIEQLYKHKNALDGVVTLTEKAKELLHFGDTKPLPATQQVRPEVTKVLECVLGFWQTLAMLERRGLEQKEAHDMSDLLTEKAHAVLTALEALQAAFTLPSVSGPFIDGGAEPTINDVILWPWFCGQNWDSLVQTRGGLVGPATKQQVDATLDRIPAVVHWRTAMDTYSQSAEQQPAAGGESRESTVATAVSSAGSQALWAVSQYAEAMAYGAGPLPYEEGS